MVLALLLHLMAAVVTDFRRMKISNRLIASGLIWGFVLRFIGEGSTGIVHFLVNISIPVILLFLFFQLRVLGAGDIKLFSVVGGFVTTDRLLLVIAAAFLAGGVIGAVKLLYLKATTGSFGKGRTLIHFSLAVLIGYCIVVWGCVIG